MGKRVTTVWLGVVLFFYLIGVALTGMALGQVAYDYIDITNPFLRKIPMAVPVFKRLTPNAAESELAQTASNLLADTLEFTGYFKILDRGAFLEDPQTTGIIAPHIQFKNWTVIGAELLVTGGIVISDGLLEAELRLYDTFQQKLVVGKRYKGHIDDTRKIIRRFCTEIIYNLTGERGIFTSKIAFESTGSGNKEIFICDFDGYDPTQVTHSKALTLSPAWSADGEWLAYTAYTRGNPDLYIKHLKDNRGNVVSKKGTNISPAWLPNQFALAASMSFSGDPEIYLLTGHGKIIKKLTNSVGIDVSPSWSPDGKHMAFVSNRSGKPQIYIKTLDSGEIRRLTYEGRYNTSPSWSPKGDKIAYTALDNGTFNVRLMGVDGSGPIQLTHDSGNNESPSWSPDGSLLVFSSTREGTSRIYIMTAFGTDQRRLLSLPGAQTNPKWSPNLISN